MFDFCYRFRRALLGGIFGRWKESVEGRPTFYGTEMYEPFEIQQLFPVVSLIVIGIFCSLITLLLEICVSRWRKIKLVA